MMRRPARLRGSTGSALAVLLAVAGAGAGEVTIAPPAPAGSPAAGLTSEP